MARQARHGAARRGGARRGKAGIHNTGNNTMDRSNLKGVQETIQAIYDETGSVTAPALVEAARPKSSPAHDAFEWDNKKAGEEYRLIQSRHYIRRVKIIVEDQPERLIHVPRVQTQTEQTNDEPSRHGHYQIAPVLVKKPDEYARALQAATMKLNAAKLALDDLYRAAESGDHQSEAGKIVQMAKAITLFADALNTMH
jgi:hypothetical protein